ncbi:serine/threonine protein kinase [Streptomyces sp. 15-116A]|uniref:serine/threonine-protein kinase n=1 Tax=Streptomyces sp. 15-116A TaxID=2259035 RepID=UPI0021B4C5A8|nr:serine/threonine-protein kinase [Streptomyces sp. 15-116A]MCT7351253.1 serine/threonine protein kinase [Streptomyces sp. 15-116A]
MEKLGPGDPQRIGAYRLLARLGAGGMGHVYLARSERGRTVAVKLVREELARQEEFRARFRQEVQAARQVGGHWTAPVLDADTEAAVPWVATGYVAGPSLQQVVGHDHGALPERSVRILAAGLAHALKDIHAAGIVHRDLKPSNVLVTIDGPRVIDFGIARALQTVTDGGLTRTGALVGSPGFMAPEQVRGDRITPACDVFCLGSVLAYAATGKLPFGTANSGVHALMFRIAQEEPDLEQIPEGLADLVRDCLKKDPAARPSLDEVLTRTGAEDTVTEGRSRDPWLPSALVAQLGRHAVQLLDTEDPEAPAPTPTAVSGTPAAATPSGNAGPSGSAGAAPAATPEHAPADDDSAASADSAGPPPPGQPGSGGPVNHLPTVVVGGQSGPSSPTPPPSPATPAGGYGHPQQHPQPSAYGYPYNGHHAGAGATPPYGPPPFYGPPGPGQDPRRDGRSSTAVLVLIALVVALMAGGTVYALMSGGEKNNQAEDPTTPPQPSTTAPHTTTGPTTDPKQPSTTAPPSDGAIPTAYLGTWSTTIDNASGVHSRELTIQQGETGDTVLSLVADGPTGNGTYHCVFEADLTSASGDSLRIGPSTVTVGQPRSACTPGSASEITLLPDGSLRRVNTSNGDELTYERD